jgi:hypothetical protein
MRERGGALRLYSLVLALFALALAAPVANAANVVNGNFETGNLEGWHAHSATGFGDWFAYTGTKPPISESGRGTAPVPAPPQGKYAAIADQLDPDTLVLFQDISLGANAKHQLSLQAFYSSNKPLAVPTPDTLSTDPAAIGSQANQQFRIDLMRPEAPLESIEPGDVLRTIFSTAAGDPVAMPPQRLTANLTPFAGQTVRLRVAIAAGKEALNGGIDDVSVASTPNSGAGGGGNGGGGGAGARFHVLGHARALANGSAVLRVRVPSAGRLTAKSPKLLLPASAKTAGPRVVSLHLKPTAKAMGMLRRKGKLRVKVALAFDPAGSAAIQRASASVRLRLGEKRRP